MNRKLSPLEKMMSDKNAISGVIETSYRNVFKMFTIYKDEIQKVRELSKTNADELETFILTAADEKDLVKFLSAMQRVLKKTERGLDSFLSKYSIEEQNEYFYHTIRVRDTARVMVCINKKLLKYRNGEKRIPYHTLVLFLHMYEEEYMLYRTLGVGV